MDAPWYELPALVRPGAPPLPDGGETPTWEQRGERALRTRQRLLLAAAECFSEHGYHSTSLRDVLDVAGLTKGALYFHFSSKLDLAQAIAQEASRRWRAILADIADRDLDPIQSMLVQTDAALVRWHTDLVFRAARRTNADLSEFGPQRSRWYASWEARTEELFRQARDQGLLRGDVDCAQLARTVVAVILGHLRVWELSGLPPDPLRRMSDSWDAILPSVAREAWVESWLRSGWHTRSLPDMPSPAGT